MAIYEYDGSELGAPGPTFMGLLTDSIIAEFADVRDEIGDIDVATDSGWTNISTFGTGWTATPNHKPRVRRVGNRVDIAGAVTRSGSGATSDILTIPVGFRLTGAFQNYFLSGVIASNLSAFQLFIAGSAGSHKLSSPYNGGVAASQVVPLAGSWYVD